MSVEETQEQRQAEHDVKVIITEIIRQRSGQIPEAVAGAIASLISAGEIPHVSIKY